MLTTILHGMSMALADSVPGVSGGTVAFILGFYERFLNAIHDFFGRDSGLRKAAFRYLVKFAIGWAVGMGGSVLILSRVFEQHIYFLSSLFLGLTLGSIPFIVYAERKCLKNAARNLVFTAIGIALVCALTFLRGSAGLSDGLHFQSLSLLQLGYLALCGMLAISAMLLPGISGSTLLLIFGVYIPAVNAAKELLHLHLEYLPGVLALAVGIGLGVILTADSIRSALRKHRSKMIYLILGLMLGSLYAICMGPTTLNTPMPALSLSSFRPLGFLLGAALPLVLEAAKAGLAK